MKTLIQESSGRTGRVMPGAPPLVLFVFNQLRNLASPGIRSSRSGSLNLSRTVLRRYKGNDQMLDDRSILLVAHRMRRKCRSHGAS